MVDVMTQAGLNADSMQRFAESTCPERGPKVTAFRPISGGYSRLSALTDITFSDGSVERFVLRADPPPDTGVFESDRDEEWRLLQALHGLGPALTPTPRWYDATGEFFGAKTMIVDFFEATPLALSASKAADLQPSMERFVDTIALVHQTPLDRLPPDMPKPAGWAGYIDDLVELIGRLDRDVADSSPPLRYAAAKLSTYRPPEVPLTLVHGDCQPANLLVAADGTTLVIDWEFGRIGDPREDLGYYSHLPVPPNLYERDPEAFLARYRERSGMTEEQLNPEVVEFFMLLGMARLLGQMVTSIDSLAHGRPRGIMCNYMINGLSSLTTQYFDVCRRLM